MRMNNTLSVVAVAVAVLAAPITSLASESGRDSGTRIVSVAPADLSALEIQNLMYMREEEKLARDVYLTLFDTWDLAVFSNIATSEQTHTDKVSDMIEKYRLADPVVDDSIGVFVNQDLANLYASLIARGLASSLEALQVGALIEEVDMIDLKRAIDETDNADIQVLYENLMSGSRNHLRAYVSRIEALGVVYAAQYLSQEEVDAIVDSPVERGGGGKRR